MIKVLNHEGTEVSPHIIISIMNQIIKRIRTWETQGSLDVIRVCIKAIMGI
jgi:hypothetical protein